MEPAGQKEDEREKDRRERESLAPWVLPTDSAVVLLSSLVVYDLHWSFPHTHTCSPVLHLGGLPKDWPSYLRDVWKPGPETHFIGNFPPFLQGEVISSVTAACSYSAAPLLSLSFFFILAIPSSTRSCATSLRHAPLTRLQPVGNNTATNGHFCN